VRTVVALFGLLDASRRRGRLVARVVFLLALAGTATWMAWPGSALALIKNTTRPGSTVDIDEPTKPEPGVDQQPNLPQRALQDTVWIADWSFDSGGGCVSTGWTHYDNRILNDGSNYWVVDNRFAGTGPIVNKSALLSKHDICWARDGYGNNWDYSVILKYSGASATLQFDKLSDSDPRADFVTVEADSLGLSEARVNYAVNPKATPEQFRLVLYLTDGLDGGSTVGPLALPNFGPGTHEVYIRFTSDDAYADEDGQYRTAYNAGLVVDNVAVTGGLAYSENFEGVLNANVTLVNTAPATPFGEWARLFQHITDNDKCTENTSCAWLFTDPARLAFAPDMAFGPGQSVIHNWLDDILVSPWVSLASTPSATGTLLSFRTFPGNKFHRGKIVQSWRVRAKTRHDNTDTPAPGDSIDCVSPWVTVDERHPQLTEFEWRTTVLGLSFEFPPDAKQVQVSARVTDWQFLTGDSPPLTLDPGPGPYLDRVRIGRRVLTGPLLEEGTDARSQAQDAFPTVQNALSPGEHFSPDGANRFGTCAFSSAADLGLNGGSSNLITGDSVFIQALDARGAGGLASVKFYGAITSGPHTGKAPAPYTVGANGFFAVTADSARTPSGFVARGKWFVDLDDTYFRGGDVLKYFWAAADNSSGFTSSPRGLSALPASVAAAEVATGGLREADYLPIINWSPTYLARIAADATGDLDPTGGELAASTQRNCILYVNSANTERRSGPLSRLSFMYTLDQLGYHGKYDVYNVQGTGNINNQLGGRANVAQASGYALIVHDAGRNFGTVPDGVNLDDAKINQAQWYRDYLAQGTSGLAGTASVWFVGENLAEEYSTNPLFANDCGIASAVADQGLNVNPDVHGIANFTFASGGVGTFIGNNFALAGGCPGLANYDGLTAGGTAVATHRYASGATTGTAAVVMNKNAVLKWNTVLSAFPWFDIVDAAGPPPVPQAEVALMSRVLSGVLPLACISGVNPVDLGDPTTDAVPIRTALHACEPNPFNPTTTLRFDLAQAGRTRLLVYDAAGRLVRTLVDATLAAGSHRAVWNGLDSSGQRSPSGVYFARLVSVESDIARKMVLLQ
jgi:hypothetical protein